MTPTHYTIYRHTGIDEGHWLVRTWDGPRPYRLRPDPNDNHCWKTRRGAFGGLQRYLKARTYYGTHCNPDLFTVVADDGDGVFLTPAPTPDQQALLDQHRITSLESRVEALEQSLQATDDAVTRLQQALYQ